VDLRRNRVLLVNDCGPDADSIEASLLTQIKGWGSIRYERNERNLGFVGTCNRSVAELDTTDNDILLLNSDTVTTPGFLEELSSVLHLSPYHGIVCPRSNDAGWASFPYLLRDPSSRREIARTAEVYAALSGTIRRYSISPVAVGFCFLVRRELIRQHGLFDEMFSPGYYEDYDFCMRMNEFGYSSIIANRAMVFHSSAGSFAEATHSLSPAHQMLYIRRYPFHRRVYQAYMFCERDPVDAFADVLVPADEIRRVLVDIDSIPTVGLTEHVNSLLAALQRMSDPKRLETSVSIPDNEREFISVRYPALRVIRHSRLDRLWDVVITSGDTVSRSQLNRLNRISPRWVFTSSGIDSVRTWRERVAKSSIKVSAQEAIRYADGIIGLRTGVTAELASYASSSIGRLPIGGMVEIDRIDADGIAQEIVERYGRSSIDIERLRVRWDYFACYERESIIRRLVGMAECAVPRPVGYAKDMARKLLRQIGGI
jgi:GT2 family glycosyltransferase